VKVKFESGVERICDLDPKVQELINKAVEARKFAYCPYSNFAVGAALRTTTGEIFTGKRKRKSRNCFTFFYENIKNNFNCLHSGCNVENGAYSPSLCAERTAIGKAVSEGFQSFEAIAVVAYQEEHFTSPCGVCRQTLSEFAPKDFPVYISKAVPARVLVTSIYKLLPHRFRPDKLKMQS
jgi:cytidine deaminase